MTPLPWWADLIIGTAAVLVALGTISRYVWPALCGLVHFIRSIARLLEDFRDTGGFAGIASTIRELAVDLTHVRTLAERADHELHPNQKMSLRDAVDRTERGITDLRQQVAAVVDQATAISERQEILRAADEATSADLKRFIENDWTETKEANAHLRASLTEALLVDRERGADEGQG